jgi:hypothetical protein
MATETPRKRPVRLIFLIYGLFALFISLALAAFAFRGNLSPFGGQATPTPTIMPTATESPIAATVTPTPGPGTPTETVAPTSVATPAPTPTVTPTSSPNALDVENPLGLPAPVLAAIFAFTTLSGIASILKFTFDSVVAIARFVGRFRST